MFLFEWQYSWKGGIDRWQMLVKMFNLAIPFLLYRIFYQDILYIRFMCACITQHEQLETMIQKVCKVENDYENAEVKYDQLTTQSHFRYCLSQLERVGIRAQKYHSFFNLKWRTQQEEYWAPRGKVCQCGPYTFHRSTNWSSAAYFRRSLGGHTVDLSESIGLRSFDPNA